MSESKPNVAPRAQDRVIKEINEARHWLENALNDAMRADRVDCCDSLRIARKHINKACSGVSHSLRLDVLRLGRAP